MIKITEPPALAGFSLRYAAFIGGIRDGVDQRIHAVLPGDLGSIASAQITGRRDAISTPVNDAMYVSSLAHVLSISGYHTAVVAGIVFFTMLQPSLPPRCHRCHRCRQTSDAVPIARAATTSDCSV